MHFKTLDMKYVVLQSPEDLHPGGNGQALWVSIQPVCMLCAGVAWGFVYLRGGSKYSTVTGYYTVNYSLITP